MCILLLCLRPLKVVKLRVIEVVSQVHERCFPQSQNPPLLLSVCSARVEDILLHYVSINSVKGTIVTPCSQPRLDGTVSPWSTGGPLHREMLMQFERMCLVLRHALHDPQQV